LLMDSGEMSFQAVLVHCLNSVSFGLMFLTGVRGQFPDCCNSPYMQCSQSVNGLLTITSRTCN
jgi:hypothetical protein